MEERSARASGVGALLVGSLLWLGACVPGRLADLPDPPARAARIPADDLSRLRAISALDDAFLRRGDIDPGRQPVLPTFVPGATRVEAVRLMLSISRMGTRPYPLDQIYARLDPSFRTGVQRLRAIGADGDAEFRQLMDELASSLGACVVPIDRVLDDLHYDGGPVVIVAPVKGERRIVEKTLTHNLGDVSQVQDLVRGSVAVDHPDDIRVVSSRTLEMLRQRRIQIVETEDHFVKAVPGGYRDFQINFRLPKSLVIGELQLHVKDLLVVKQRVGHDVYERARLACSALQMGITSADISAICTRNAGEMAASYGRAYLRSLVRPRLQVRPCLPARMAGRAVKGPAVRPESVDRRALTQPIDRDD